MSCRARASSGVNSSKQDHPAAQHVVPNPDAPVLNVPSSTTKPSRPVRRSSYRRTRPTEEEIREAKSVERLERKQQESNVTQWAQALKQEGPHMGRSLGGAPAVRPSLLLVDGYNILHMDLHLRQLFHEHSMFARAELEKWVDAYARAANVLCMLVFDAMMGSVRQDSAQRVSPWLSVVYSVHSEADSLIVRQAREARRQGAYKVVVVSNDTRIHMELQDEDQVFMLHAPTFMRHLKESNQGDTSGPEAWRQLWSTPQPGGLGTYQLPVLKQQPQLTPKQPEAAVAVARDVAELQLELWGIVEVAQQRQQAGLARAAAGSAYLQMLLAGEDGQRGTPSRHDTLQAEGELSGDLHARLPQLAELQVPTAASMAASLEQQHDDYDELDDLLHKKL